MCAVQAHREVFEYLIEDFRTYKPLLSAIKTEYELYITHLQQRIGELEPMRVCVGPRTERGGEGGGGRAERHVTSFGSFPHPIQSQVEVMRDECERKILSFSEEEKIGEYVVRGEGVRVMVMCLLQERLKWRRRINA